MGRIGLQELLFLGLLLLVVMFGATKLPQIGRGMGEGIREFKKALKGGASEDEAEAPKPEKKSS